MSVPYSLLRHHGAMLSMGARVLAKTALNSMRPAGPATGAASASASAAAVAASVAAPLTRVIAAPPRRLIDAYIAWAGAHGHYADRLPPHMVSQCSLPLVGELLLRMPYRLTSVINQGVELRVNGPLPRDTRLHLSAAVAQVEETPGRTKVVVAVNTGTAQQADLVQARLHMSFLQPGPRGPRPQQERPPEPAWLTAGLWQADRRDGLHFALLSGDFNPIHWCGPLARRSVFRGLVLHGFGSFVRSYEVLRQQGMRFNEIDVRFIKPVPLPSPPLSVQVAPEPAPDADGWRALRLSGDGVVHLAGRLRQMPD